jgi:hypothetical protein
MSAPKLVIGDGTGWVDVKCGADRYLGRVEEPLPPVSDSGTLVSKHDPLEPPAAGTEATEGEEEPELEDDGLYLNPCYEVHRAVQNPGTPKQGIIMQAVPYGLFARDVRVRLEPTVVVEFADLHPDDRDMLRAMIIAAEEMKTNMRAARARLVLAT